MNLETLLPYLACPKTHLPLCIENGGSYLTSSPNAVRYEVRNGVPILLPLDLEPIDAQFAGLALQYEQKYREEPDPWQYETRAGEMLRHEYVTQTVGRLCRGGGPILDIGCGNGRLSVLLHSIAKTVLSLDISYTAVERARKRIHALPGIERNQAGFVVGSATDLPIRENVMRVVVASDGIQEWSRSPDAKDRMIVEAFRVLAPNGYAVFTDYLRPERFEEYVQTIQSSRFRTVSIEYLHDRLWYSFESMFHSVRHSWIAKVFLRNMAVARGLRLLASAAGPKASRHICVVMQKEV